MKVENYVQCRLTRTPSGTDPTSEQTAWIPLRGARVGLVVELLPSRELWTVAEAFIDNKMRSDLLRRMQDDHRGSLPSVEAMPRA